ncbi:hypothetical protein JAAARDRAFT_31242 [Jaapia argillacea MUCL 33604]|uniref:Zn(2)-C6 fungal-type domain-containing protein n=1 Tax=Jaapia argillacea MUCL 33604 TaxID=933084 RepID=A0A067QE26_9AGAM|nr:hypothetical protein JAAARDRAFT_31242 [Jaapia argillacea MUCL 33604]
MHPSGPASSSYDPPSDFRAAVVQSHFSQQAENFDAKVLKVPKRKRLAKACDACHKSKRRCDGTGNYFASKECSYTDASGRPVAAPRAGHPSEERQSGGHPRNPANNHGPAPPVPPSALIPSTHKPYYSEVVSSGLPHDREQEVAPRKRVRAEPEPYILPKNLGHLPPLPGATSVESNLGLDATLTRELVNLFFTHCHPARLVIHKPSFSAALSLNQVPLHLLFVIYALAAPLSKRPQLRTSPARDAGTVYFEEAMAMMYDSNGRLICEPSLATAQALCILQIHMLRSGGPETWHERYHDLALEIVENLEVRKPDNPVLTPVPSPEFIQASIDRECTRRVFWFIHWMDMVLHTYVYKPISRPVQDFSLRLPVDETSFELAVHVTLSEYLYLPPPRTRYASEFGHMVRISRILYEFENNSNSLGASADDQAIGVLLLDTVRTLECWASTLPEHLQFNEQNLQVQLSMFETSSNNGAWCYCFMHVEHASCILGINEFKRRHRKGTLTGQDWAMDCLHKILSFLGSRAKNSFILGAIVWALQRYCKDDDPKLRMWNAEFADLWGVQVEDYAMTDRSTVESPELHHSPPSAIVKATKPALPPPSSSTNSLVRSTGNAPHNYEGRSERTEAPLLPSLKSSGLLDSWKPPSEPSATTVPRSRWIQSSGRNPSPTRPPNNARQDSSRPSGTGMPVGLQWLAHET